MTNHLQTKCTRIVQAFLPAGSSSHLFYHPHLLVISFYCFSSFIIWKFPLFGLTKFHICKLFYLTCFISFTSVQCFALSEKNQFKETELILKSLQRGCFLPLLLSPLLLEFSKAETGLESTLLSYRDPMFIFTASIWIAITHILRDAATCFICYYSCYTSCTLHKENTKLCIKTNPTTVDTQLGTILSSSFAEACAHHIFPALYRSCICNYCCDSTCFNCYFPLQSMDNFLRLASYK